LRKHLDLVVAKVQNRIVNYSKEYVKAQEKAKAKVDEATQKLRDKGVDEEQIKVETNYLKQQKLLIGWASMTKVALSKAFAAVQKIKADPSVATYGAEMNAGGRDVSQQFNNILKLVADSKCPKELVKEMAGLSGHRETLTAFGTGAKRTVPPTATQDEILTQVKEFSQLIKALMPYYDKMAKYLSEHKL
jgi:hypothetical protein